MKKILKYPFLLMVIVIIGVFSIAGFFIPEVTFSEVENRMMETKPQISVQGIMDSSFTTAYETYMNDQFPFRNHWIQGKAVGEKLLGKVENNGIIQGKDGYLFNKELALGRYYEGNLSTIQEFANRISIPVSLSIVPNSYSVLEDKLPKGVPEIDQNANLDQLAEQFLDSEGVEVIDFREVLESHRDEYLYYRTDHHWTTLAAYYSYQEFCEKKGLTALEEETLHKETADGFLGTYAAKFQGIGMQADTITYYDFPGVKVVEDGQERESIYDLEKLATRDKYAMFLGGNSGLTTIVTEGNGQTEKRKNLLLFKDSYANCFIPFLTSHYEEIFVVDLRYYRGNLKELIQQESIEEVYFLYNFDTFMSDNNIYKLIL